MRAVRITLYIVILSALFFMPVQHAEIASLEPIQGVWMHLENGNIVLQTDTEDKGVGDTVENALADMKKNSSGIIYLDTAQYLFTSETAQSQIQALQTVVKGSVMLCQWDGQGSVDEAVKYADSHKIGLPIRKWTEGSKLPEIPPVKQEK